MRQRLSRYLMPSIAVAALCVTSLGGVAVLPGCSSGAARTGIVSGKGNVSELVGIRAQGLYGEMSRRGYANVSGHQAGAGSITVWLNPRTGECARVETRQGRVAATESNFGGECK